MKKTARVIITSKCDRKCPGVLQQQIGLHIIGESDWRYHGIKGL